MAEIRHSVCALDCPDCCSLVLTVQDGHATRLRGNPEHPVTRGFLCGKVAQYLEREYHPERLLYPRRRVGTKGAGRFERIAWDEALDTIAGRLRAVADEFGSEAILPYSYGGSMGLVHGSGMERRFFYRLGASRLDRTSCSSAGGVGLTRALGARYGTEPEQFRHAKLIIAWGANILGTNVHLWPFVMEARRNGAKLYTIDPNRNRTGAASDKHFFINPGSDIALVLAMMHVIVGRAGSAAQRREAVHHRPEPQSHRRGQRQAFLHQSRQRYRAGAGHDARDRWRWPARRRLRGALHRRLRLAARAGTGVAATARGGAHRHRRG